MASGSERKEEGESRVALPFCLAYWPRAFLDRLSLEADFLFFSDDATLRSESERFRSATFRSSDFDRFFSGRQFQICLYERHGLET